MTLKIAAVAFASVVLLNASTRAGDLMDDLATMDLDSINETAADVEEFDLASLDVSQLGDELETDSDGAAGSETDAIEAAFRRFGGFRGGRGWNQWGGHRNYGHRNYGHRNFGYRSLGRCYSTYHSYCQPTYHGYRPIVRHCYTPLVRHCYPVVTSYWGCH